MNFVELFSVVTQSHKIPNFIKNFLIFSTKKKSSLVLLKPTGQTDTNKINSVKGSLYALREEEFVYPSLRWEVSFSKC